MCFLMAPAHLTCIKHDICVLSRLLWGVAKKRLKGEGIAQDEEAGDLLELKI